MKDLAKLPLILVSLCLLAAPVFAQDTIVTTEMIGSLSGSFTVTYPSSPICPASGQQDTVAFTGSVHVGASVDLTTNSVDYHINLLSVKGTGTLVSKYIANGATDLPD